MKYSIIFIFISVSVITAKAQSLLLKKDLGKFYTFDAGKYFDKKEYKIFAPKKKYGTFYFEGRPLKATRLFLNLNGNITSSQIDGIFGFPAKKRSVVIDSLPNQTAKFLYNTDKGKVYPLPLDNMPCLVPQINSNMPVAKLYMKEYKKIPNALQEQKLIPQTETSINPSEKNNK